MNEQPAYPQSILISNLDGIGLEEEISPFPHFAQCKDYIDSLLVGDAISAGTSVGGVPKCIALLKKLSESLKDEKGKSRLLRVMKELGDKQSLWHAKREEVNNDSIGHKPSTCLDFFNFIDDEAYQYVDVNSKWKTREATEERPISEEELYKFWLHPVTRGRHIMIIDKYFLENLNENEKFVKARLMWLLAKSNHWSFGNTRPIRSITVFFAQLKTDLTCLRESISKIKEEFKKFNSDAGYKLPKLYFRQIVNEKDIRHERFHDRYILSCLADRKYEEIDGSSFDLGFKSSTGFGHQYCKWDTRSGEMQVLSQVSKSIDDSTYIKTAKLLWGFESKRF